MKDSAERLLILRRMSKTSETNYSVGDGDKKKEKLDGQKLIETEKSETGSVKPTVYLHYLRAVGCKMTLFTMLFYFTHQCKCI